MKYIFHDGQVRGEYPVESFQIGWYDMTTKDKSCFDESVYKPEQFDPPELLSYLETKENESDDDRCRTFAHMKNGNIYEIVLWKIDNPQAMCYFWGDYED